ncbi:unnamed protein product [Calypogeia fissa]
MKANILVWYDVPSFLPGLDLKSDLSKEDGPWSFVKRIVVAQLGILEATSSQECEGGRIACDRHFRFQISVVGAKG